MPEPNERRYYRIEALDKLGNSEDGEVIDTEDRVECGRDEANLVSSLCHDGLHRPCIDIDLPCRLVPTSTPGHFHLYIEKGMTFERYAAILCALEAAGVYGPVQLKRVLARGATFCRPEWVKKGDPSAPGS